MPEPPSPQRSLLLFVLVFAGLLAWVGLPDRLGPRMLQVLLEGAAVVVAVQLAGASRRLLPVLAAGVVLVVAVGVVSGVSDGRVGRTLVAVVHLLLVVVVPPLLVSSLRSQRAVTVQTVLGALTVYLLIGQFFASAYAVLAAVDPAPFFSNGTDGSPADMSYFSFVTLTTVGFGDFTAATRPGRMLVVLEALAGQFYLVTVVALTVGNLRRQQAGGPHSSQ